MEAKKLASEPQKLLAEEIQKTQFVMCVGSGASFALSVKFAHTLRSLGIRSMATTSEELLHGDIGALQEGDVMIVLSRSGRVSRLSEIGRIVKQKRSKLWLVSESQNFPENVDLALIRLEATSEVDPLGVVPSNSFVAMAQFLDLIMKEITHGRESYGVDFAESHPSGGIGNKFTSKVSSVTTRGAICLLENQRVSILELEEALSLSMVGCVCVTNTSGDLLNVLTDGDVRRLITQRLRKFDGDFELKELLLEKRAPICVRPTMTIVDALKIFQAEKISLAPILNSAGKVSGILHLRDLSDFLVRA